MASGRGRDSTARGIGALSSRQAAPRAQPQDWSAEDTFPVRTGASHGAVLIVGRSPQPKYEDPFGRRRLKRKVAGRGSRGGKLEQGRETIRTRGRESNGPKNWKSVGGDRKTQKSGSVRDFRGMHASSVQHAIDEYRATLGSYRMVFALK
jgi:hypothetical protein